MFDLAVPEAALAGDGARVLGMLVRFGFRGIAISVTSDGNLNKSKPCQIDRSKYAAMLEKAAGDAVVPRASPPLLAQANSDLPRSLAATTFDLFTRLSVVLDNPSHNYSISSGSPIVASYDILAVHPKTEKLFQAACQQLEVDIVSLDMGSRLPFHLRHPTINAAIQRGVHFEICYAPAIRDSTARRHIISNSAALMRATKGRNIVLSSELVQAFDLRGPHDIANL
nr:Ribonuclease P protein subunit p30 [Polyrhizophydium stewartii]